MQRSLQAGLTERPSKMHRRLDTETLWAGATAASDRTSLKAAMLAVFGRSVLDTWDAADYEVFCAACSAKRLMAEGYQAEAQKIIEQYRLQEHA